MIGLVLAAATLGLLIFAVQMIGGAIQTRLADEGRAPPARERQFSVNVLRAEFEDVRPVLETFGEVQSRRRLELRATAAGRVVALADAFEDGGEVAEGDVLVQLDRRDAQAALERAQSDLADAEAEVRDAARGLTLARDELSAAEDQAELRERALTRQRDLGERGVTTATASEAAELAASAARQAVLSRRQAFNQAEARTDQAATGLTRARIALSDAERRLADTRLVAPFDGTLDDTNVVVGGLVAANEQLASLIDPDDLEVSFRLSTAQYVRLLDPQGDIRRAPVRVTLDVAGVDLEAEGQITRARAGAGEGSTGRLVFASLTSAAGFKPGDFVTVRVEEPVLAEVVVLPASAVDAAGQVLVLGAENRLDAVEVEVLRRQGDDVLVRGDIVGREVVEARSPLLGAGILVIPLRKDGAAPEEPAMITLTDQRRAALVALVESNTRMPEEAKARVLAKLAEPIVPRQMVERIEARMGG